MMKAWTFLIETMIKSITGLRNKRRAEAAEAASKKAEISPLVALEAKYTAEYFSKVVKIGTNNLKDGICSFIGDAAKTLGVKYLKAVTKGGASYMLVENHKVTISNIRLIIGGEPKAFSEIQEVVDYVNRKFNEVFGTTLEMIDGYSKSTLVSECLAKLTITREYLPEYYAKIDDYNRLVSEKKALKEAHSKEAEKQLASNPDIIRFERSIREGTKKLEAIRIAVASTKNQLSEASEILHEKLRAEFRFPKEDELHNYKHTVCAGCTIFNDSSVNVITHPTGYYTGVDSYGYTNTHNPTRGSATLEEIRTEAPEPVNRPSGPSVGINTRFDSYMRAAQERLWFTGSQSYNNAGSVTRPSDLTVAGNNPLSEDTVERIVDRLDDMAPINDAFTLD